MSGRIDGARPVGAGANFDDLEPKAAAPAKEEAAPAAAAAPKAAPAAKPAGAAPPAAPSSGGPRRAGTDIAIGNPFTSSDVHASHYSAVAASMGYALDRLAEKYPDVNRNFAARFLELALVTGAEVPTMVYSHEMGHYREAKRVGGDPSIEMTGFASGLTHYELPEGKTLTAAERAALSAAGVNQEQLNAVYMFQKWARNGGARYQEAMGYLLAQTNLALYAANTARHELGGTVKSSDDIAAYMKALNARGHDLKLGHLVAMSAAADLASAPVWASLIGQIRFLASGDRNVEMPTVKIGDLKSTFPNFHMLLSADGPVIGGNVVLNPDKKVPVEVTFDVRVDKEKAAALGIKLYDVPITDRVSVNPFLRATYDERKGAGIMVGTDLQAKVYKDVAITGSVSFSHNDLLAGPTGKGNGVDMRVGVSIPF